MGDVCSKLLNQLPSHTRSHGDTRRSHLSLLVTYSYAHFSNGPVIFYCLVVCFHVTVIISIFVTFQRYVISWICSGCYHKKSGSQVSLQNTTTTFSNLERDQTFTFSVYAITNFGRGDISTITATISRYFGQVQNLRQRFENYTLILEWDQPSDVEAKDIKVSCAIVFLG